MMAIHVRTPPAATGPLPKRGGCDRRTRVVLCVERVPSGCSSWRGICTTVRWWRRVQQMRRVTSAETRTEKDVDRRVKSGRASFAMGYSLSSYTRWRMGSEDDVAVCARAKRHILHGDSGVEAPLTRRRYLRQAQVVSAQ
jgi:hypothetical protein